MACQRPLPQAGGGRGGGGTPPKPPRKQARARCPEPAASGCARELRGAPVTLGYITMGGFVPAQDAQGWYDTGDLGYLTEKGHVVVCGRVKDVIIMAGRSIYPTDIERAAGRVEGVRPGCAVAVRLNDGHS